MKPLGDWNASCIVRYRTFERDNVGQLRISSQESAFGLSTGETPTSLHVRCVRWSQTGGRLTNHSLRLHRGNYYNRLPFAMTLSVAFVRLHSTARQALWGGGSVSKPTFPSS